MIELDVTTQVYGADQRRDSCLVAFPKSTLPLRDIIALKARAEIDRAERSQEAEHALSMRYLIDEDLAWARGGAAKPNARVVDTRQEIERALSSFTEGRYFVVVDGRRRDNLDEAIELAPTTTIKFIRILPLRGGACSPG